MKRAALLIVLLAGCFPDPVPDPPPDPNGTPCEQAADRFIALHCGDVTRAAYADACERYESAGGANSWNPTCQREAQSCQQIEDCRSQ